MKVRNYHKRNKCKHKEKRASGGILMRFEIDSFPKNKKPFQKREILTEEETDVGLQDTVIHGEKVCES